VSQVATQIQGVTPAEENELLILNLVKGVKWGFVELGGLLAENSDKAYWGLTGHESFKDFVEELGVGSYSWVTRLMDISRIVAQEVLTREQVIEIGVAKCCLLLPLAKKGKLSEDLIELAKVCPYRDLRQKLGGGTQELTEVERFICCPRCGNEFPFHEDMLKEAK